jgi:RNA recognition motif-containing protein
MFSSSLSLDTASKRKIEESPTGKEPETKMTKVEGIGDLIVLGLPFRTTEPEMKEYFSQFGEVDYCEVCSFHVLDISQLN